MLALLVTYVSAGGTSLAAGPPATIAVELSPATILADGHSTSTVTVTITDASGAPVAGETVQVFASDKGVSFSPDPALDNGNGTYTSTLTSSLVAGMPAILALDGPLVSSPTFLTQTAASTTSLAVVADGPVTTANLPVSNQAVTLVATVAPTPSNLPPSGTVAFENGGNPIAGCASVPTPALPGPTVTVTCGTSFAAADSPAKLTAVFSPTPGSLVMGSTSPTQTFAINRDPTTTSVTMLGSRANVATAMSFVASVTPSQQGPLSPAGSVQFMDNGQAIGSCSNQPLGASSTATCTLSYRKLGDHSITASYPGDMSFDGSASAPVTFSLQALGTIDATLQWTFDFTPAYTQVRGLVLDAVPPGASVLLRCQGHGCPFARRVIVASPTRPCGPRGRHRCATHGGIDLTPPLRHKHLSPGARITVEVLKPGWVGKYYMFTVRAGRRPSTRISCTAPGTTSPGPQC